MVKCIRFDEPALDVSHYVVVYMQRPLIIRVRAVNRGLPKPKNLFLSYATGKPLRGASIAKQELIQAALRPIPLEEAFPQQLPHEGHLLRKLWPRETGKTWGRSRGFMNVFLKAP